MQATRFRHTYKPWDVSTVPQESLLRLTSPTVLKDSVLGRYPNASLSRDPYECRVKVLIVIY